MKKRMVWTVVLALCMGLMMGSLTACSKKAVGPGELSAEEQARLRAEEERRLREQRLREGQAGGSLTPRRGPGAGYLPEPGYSLRLRPL